MAREATCPVCSAYIPLENDDRMGDYVFCSYCGARLRLGDVKTREIPDRDEEIEVEEDWE